MATTAQGNNIFARLGLKPKSLFAAVSESSDDEPGDPHPGLEGQTIIPQSGAGGQPVTSHSQFAGVAPSAPVESGDPTPLGGTPQNPTTLPSRGTSGGNFGHGTGTTGGTKP
ncbi:hypothetical protein LTR67_003778 [Exophiala xenobiotica]